MRPQSPSGSDDAEGYVSGSDGLLATRRARWAGGLLVAAMLWTFGRGTPGYDLQYALVWGAELGSGNVPDLRTPYAPTPHPLANATGALLSLLGPTVAAEVSLAFVAASAGVLFSSVWLLVARVAGAPAGLLAALLVLSRPTIVASTGIGSIDIPALALSVGAALLLLGGERRWFAALALLAVAGLLRPELWLVSVVIAMARFRESRSLTRRQLASLVGLTLAAPLIWAGADLLTAGQPWYSLTATRELASQLDRPRSVTDVPILLPLQLSATVGPFVAIAGCIALVAVGDRFWSRASPLWIMLVVPMAGFVVLGFAGLPLLARYLLLPGLALCAFAAALAASRDPVQKSSYQWSRWTARLLIVAALPGTFVGISRAAHLASDDRAVIRDLNALITSPAARSAVANCPPLRVGTYRLLPTLELWSNIDRRSVALGEGSGTLLLPASAAAVAAISAASDRNAPIVRPLDPRARILDVPRSRHWGLAQDCSPQRAEAARQ